MSLLDIVMIMATIVTWLFFFLVGFSTVGMIRGYANKLDELSGDSGELKPLRMSKATVIFILVVIALIVAWVGWKEGIHRILPTAAMLLIGFSGYFIGFHLSNWIALAKERRKHK